MVNILQSIVNAAISCLMKMSRKWAFVHVDISWGACRRIILRDLVNVNYQLKEESLGLWASATSLGTCHWQPPLTSAWTHTSFFFLENARELQFFVYKEEENKFWLHIAEHHRLTLSWHVVVWNKNNQPNTHESRQSRIRDLGSLAPGEEGSTRFRAACWLRLQVPGTVIFCRTWLPNASHSETVAQAFNQSSHGVDPRVKKLRQRRQRSRNWKIAERRKMYTPM